MPVPSCVCSRWMITDAGRRSAAGCQLLDGECPAAALVVGGEVQPDLVVRVGIRRVDRRHNRVRDALEVGAGERPPSRRKQRSARARRTRGRARARAPSGARRSGRRGRYQASTRADAPGGTSATSYVKAPAGVVVSGSAKEPCAATWRRRDGAGLGLRRQGQRTRRRERGLRRSGRRCELDVVRAWGAPFLQRCVSPLSDAVRRTVHRLARPASLMTGQEHNK